MLRFREVANVHGVSSPLFRAVHAQTSMRKTFFLPAQKRYAGILFCSRDVQLRDWPASFGTVQKRWRRPYALEIKNSLTWKRRYPLLCNAESYRHKHRLGKRHLPLLGNSADIRVEFPSQSNLIFRVHVVQLSYKRAEPSFPPARQEDKKIFKKYL